MERKVKYSWVTTELSVQKTQDQCVIQVAQTDHLSADRMADFNKLVY